MQKSKFLTFLVVGLLISNLILVGFLSFKKLPHPKYKESKHIIVERLHFNELPSKEYDFLIKKHENNLQKEEREMRELKNLLFNSLAQAKSDSLINEISAVQNNIKHHHFNYFLAIKKLCKKNQQDDFKELTKELRRLFQPKYHRRKR